MSTAALVGSLLLFVGTLAGATVTYLGKRGENAISGYSSLTEKLQKERDRLEIQVAERDAKIAELRDENERLRRERPGRTT